MPPSAGACQTTEAAVKPDCGRAACWSSTITAIGWRDAACGLTRRPVSGAATRLGPRVGVGAGGRDGAELAEGWTSPLGAGEPPGGDDGSTPDEGGALPRPATRPEPAGT